MKKFLIVFITLILLLFNFPIALLENIEEECSSNVDEIVEELEEFELISDIEQDYNQNISTEVFTFLDVPAKVEQDISINLSNVFNYSIVALNDAYIDSHIRGSIWIGGTLTSNTWCGTDDGSLNHVPSGIESYVYNNQSNMYFQGRTQNQSPDAYNLLTFDSVESTRDYWQTIRDDNWIYVEPDENGYVNLLYWDYQCEGGDESQSSIEKIYWTDATSVDMGGLAGHLFAPFAEINITWCNHCGSVVGWNIITHGEAHINYYNPISPTPTPTFTPTPTITPTIEPTSTPTIEPTLTPIITIEPTPSQTPIVELTQNPTIEPTETPTITEAPTPTLFETPRITPTIEPTPTITPTLIPKPTFTPFISPSPTPTPTATEEQTPLPTPIITVAPTLEIPTKPVPTATIKVTIEPTVEITQLPTPAPTIEVTPIPMETLTPTIVPTIPIITLTPSPEPTEEFPVEMVFYITKEPTPKPTPTPTPTLSPEEREKKIKTEKVPVRPKHVTLFSSLKEEELEDLLIFMDYETPLYGGLLATGDETPVWVYILIVIGIVCIGIYFILKIQGLH